MRARFSRTLPVIAAAATALVILSGCSASTPETETTSNELLGSVDTMFGQIDVPAVDGELKVVALGWSDAEMALALGIKPIAVFDWQSFGEDNKGVGPWATDLFGDETPVVIPWSADELNYEQLEVLDPDVILNTRSANDEAQFERLSEIAPTIYGPEGSGAYTTAWDVQMTSVSQALGLADEGQDTITEVKDAIAAAKTDNPEFAGKSIASIGTSETLYYAYMPGDGRYDILEQIGFENAEAISAAATGSFYIEVPFEQVSIFESDVAVVLPLAGTIAEAEADTLLGSLDVVKDGRAVYVDPASDLSGTFSAASVLSIPLTLELLVPQLKEAAAKLG